MDSWLWWLSLPRSFGNWPRQQFEICLNFPVLGVWVSTSLEQTEWWCLMLPGTRATTPRPCAGCTATGRRSRATSTDWFLITPWRRRSMTVRSPSRACQVSVDEHNVPLSAFTSLSSCKSCFCGFCNCFFLRLKTRQRGDRHCPRAMFDVWVGSDMGSCKKFMVVEPASCSKVVVPIHCCAIYFLCSSPGCCNRLETQGVLILFFSLPGYCSS